MGSCQDPKPVKLTETQLDQIKAEVKQAAIDHLHTKDALTALSHYTENAIAASNTTLYSSVSELAKDIHAYYETLKEVNLAVWDEMHIQVIDTDAVLVTATFRYSFTNTNNTKADLKGVWTALYIRRDGHWKIQVRHESFASVKK